MLVSPWGEGELHTRAEGVNGSSSFTLDVNRQLTPKLVTYEVAAVGGPDNLDLVVVRDDTQSSTRSHDGRWIDGRPDVYVPMAMQALLDAGVARDTLDDHFEMIASDADAAQSVQKYRGGLDAAAALFPAVGGDAIAASVDLYLDGSGFVVQMRAVIVGEQRTIELRYDLVEVDGTLISMEATG